MKTRSDRRAKTLALTPEGRRLVAQVDAVSAEVRAEALGDLSDRDLDVAMRVLSAVRDRLADILEPVPA